ncbi:MFS transporter [Paraburkholderia caribensis]|uniref:MFS transporter n=1 Tax=Paraburkholderia TaxID=1822464 RepID=UPI001CB47304|nr:MFS transporter [Paraburkholderia caribensis]BEU25671.1 MFS transporter [Paraburkholderia sp. 22B1P]CAG9249326.1 4-hydroxybenzoate transporter PcaK [Paraburkholderia caribensis]
MKHSEAALDVQNLINESRFSPYQRWILLLCFLIVAADGLDTAMIGFVAPSIAHEWNMSKAALGPVVSAALVGLAIGALFSGPLADMIGRKKVLIGSVFVFGGFSVACAFAASPGELTVFRFLTGIGLGAAMPNATTLMSEYAPERKRSLIVNAAFCGFPIGASVGGFLVAALNASYGWRGAFLVGGVFPIVLGFLLLKIPESIRFMVLRKYPSENIARVLRKIAPDAPLDGARFVLPEAPETSGKTGASIVLSGSYRIGTLTLWGAFICSLAVFYMVTTWLPIIIRQSGLSLQQAALITTMFPLGGAAGSILVGWFMDRREPHRVIAIAYLFLGLFVWMIGQQFGSVTSLTIFTLVAGFAMGGAQSSMPTLAASFYPTGGRATGVAWMLGFGRLGAVLGAFAGAMMLQANVSIPTIFAAMAVPSLFAAIMLEIKRVAGSGRQVTNELDSSTKPIQTRG